jgi:hypothetical protein
MHIHDNRDLVFCVRPGSEALASFHGFSSWRQNAGVDKAKAVLPLYATGRSEKGLLGCHDAQGKVVGRYSPVNSGRPMIKKYRGTCEVRIVHLPWEAE